MDTQRIDTDFKSAKQAYLIPISQPGQASFELGEFLTIGRDPSSHLVLKDDYVSTRHARIERCEGRFVIRDLQSRNGTFLNGSRITEATLTANDRLCFGETVYVFSENLRDEQPLRSKNEAWNEQLKRLPALAATDFPILITGASGTGKEVLARAVHRHSGRNTGPFISINCSALSESLIESELFGHVRGSFTGATHDRKGAFEAARGGTLFLDEIGDLPLALQPKLLRAIENKEIRPVGSDRTIETDVRLLAATHKNIKGAVAAGQFREDLFYRLNVCQLQPPRLRDRLEDFEDLLYSFAKQHRVRFSFGAIEDLKRHPWSGNVRELKNVVARASAYYPGRHIQPEDLERIIELGGAGPEVQLVAERTSLSPQSSLIKEIEREMIIRRLSANQGNQRRTALDLGIPKSTLNDRIKAYAIDVRQLTDGMAK